MYHLPMTVVVLFANDTVDYFLSRHYELQPLRMALLGSKPHKTWASVA